MHILELCLSPSYGGLEIHFVEFSRWLAKTSDVRVSVAIGSESMIDSKLPGSEFVQKLPISKKVTFLLKAIRLSKFIAEHQIDLIHVHAKADIPLVAVTKAISKKNFYFVFTRQMSLPAKKFDPYHKFIYAKIDKIIVITEKLKRQALNNLPVDPTKIKRVYIGVRRPPPLSIKEKHKIAAELSFGNNFIIGNLSRIEHQKGQHIFLQALHILQQEGYSIRGIVMGRIMDENYKRDLDHYISGKNLNVTIFDHSDDVLQIMRCLDALVLTTKGETFGMSLVEGMFCEIAVLGSDSGGVPEIIDHEKTGLLFKTFDSDSLAANLKVIIDNQSFRNRLAQAGFRTAVERFDLDQQFTKFKKCLLSLTL